MQSFVLRFLVFYLFLPFIKRYVNVSAFIDEHKTRISVSSVAKQIKQFYTGKNRQKPVAGEFIGQSYPLFSLVNKDFTVNPTEKP